MADTQTAQKEAEVQDDEKKQQIEAVVGAKSTEGQGLSWPKFFACVVGALACLFLFLVGLSLMGSAFKVFGGRGASSIFGAVDNPVSGLMAGILATVLVQSSSTSTSIVVAMVGEGALTVKTGIPIIMGANIGTSVTNTIVSMSQMGNRIDLERSFAGATVHDMFNMLSVATLLPLEAIIGAIQGEGGPLYWLTKAITERLMGGEGGNKLFTSPIKTMTAPIVDGILKANKYVIYALTLEKPTSRTPLAVNETLCQPLNSTRRLSATDVYESGVEGQRVMPLQHQMRRVSELPDCSQYYCVGSDLSKQLNKIKKGGLVECGDGILDSSGEPCGKQNCYLNAGKFYEDKVETGEIIKGGFLKGLGDTGGGIVGLLLSILMLCLGLFGLCKTLQIIFMGNAKRIVRHATKLNDYVAMAIGVAVTIVAQSSSVVTSALTPLCGIGVLPLEKMLPLTLGANIGTTMTAMIASLVSLKFGAVQIALCHLTFNIFGILIWFPFPPMRQIPLGGARLLGLYASHFRFVPALYILVAFLLIPLICLGIGAVFDASIAGGVVLLLVVLAAVGVFVTAWVIGIPPGNALCYKVLSKEDREQGKIDLDKANAEIMGLTPQQDSISETPEQSV
jgi:sodium-dependent phosphate cotransporter